MLNLYAIIQYADFYDFSHYNLVNIKNNSNFAS